MPYVEAVFQPGADDTVESFVGKLSQHFQTVSIVNGDWFAERRRIAEQAIQKAMQNGHIFTDADHILRSIDKVAAECGKTLTVLIEDDDGLRLEGRMSATGCLLYSDLEFFKESEELIQSRFHRCSFVENVVISNVRAPNRPR